jgi:hypothetical protein
MQCWKVKSKVAAYLDNAVAEQEHREMRQHMSNCGDCARESERYQRIREALRSLPQRTVPPDLTLRLRLSASKARAAVASGASPRRRFFDRLQLGLANLMRPLALPLAGGVCSAIFLFSALVPTFISTYAANKQPGTADVPTMLNTEPMVKYMAPVAFGEADAAVDLTIDEQGRVVNYAFVNASGPQTEELRRRIENNLLFAEFWPATAFGHPIAGTIRVWFRSTHLDVKG